MSLKSRYLSRTCQSGPSVKRKPVASCSNVDRIADDRLERRIADLDAHASLAAFFCSSLTRVAPTYQSSAATSSNTTQTASLGSLRHLADRRR